MSGTKRITIDTREYEHLKTQSARLRSVRDDLPRLIEAAHRSTVEQTNRLLSPLMQRQAHLEGAISELSSDMAEMARGFYAQLQSSNTYFEGVLRDHATAIVSLSERLEKERLRREQEIAEISARLETIEASRKRNVEAAGSRLADARRLERHAREFTLHEVFDPGRLDRIALDIVDAQESLDGGMAEACYSKCQGASRELLELIASVQFNEQKWIALQAEVLRTLGELHANTAVAKSCELELPGLSTSQVDMDYWSSGKLTELQDCLETMRLKIEKGPTHTSLHELDSLIRDRIPEIERQIESTKENAKRALIASQTRCEVGALLAEAFEEQSYAVVESLYIDDDMRGPYGVRLGDAGGNEVVVLVEPGGEDSGPTIQIFSFDANRLEESLLHARAEEVRRAVLREGKEMGLTMGDIETESSLPDETYRDLRRVSRMQRAHQP